MEQSKLKEKVLIDISKRLNFVGGKILKTIMDEIELEFQHYDIVHCQDKKPIKSVDSFIDDVLVEFCILKKVFLKPSRGKKDIATLRHAVMYILFRYYGLTQGVIAEKLNRDRTTVLYAIQISKNYIETKDPLYMDFYDKCLNKLYEENN